MGFLAAFSTMIDSTSVSHRAATTEASTGELAAARANAIQVVVLSAWCGLVSGLLEVGIIVLRKHTFDTNHLYLMSRHFVWLIPVTNLLIFLVVGMLSSLVVLWWRPSGCWLALRLLCALSLLPPLWAAAPRIFGPAGFLVALGISAWLVPALERRAARFGVLVRFSFPCIVGLVLMLAVSPWGINRIKEWRAEARPQPAPGSPNALLIVLDTVAANHLALYGYNRPTSSTLDELAPRGIRFDRVFATSSWTLPSHASMFTGRWPHELSVGWLTPLDGAHPTLAEFLGSRGYATAGMVANQSYCALDSGLGRGFDVYRDYIFPQLTAFKMAALVNRPLDGLRAVLRFFGDELDVDLLRRAAVHLAVVFDADRKEAADVSSEFLDWLSRRRQPQRPFFAFLNYNDAHSPYQLPSTGIHRFGIGTDEHASNLIQDWYHVAERGPSKREIALVRDAYDECIANLDEHLGRLIDELGRRGVLDRTWVIIVGDHGESFGEHDGVFRHGTSLYGTERHVPLVIIPPSGSKSARVVTETVSLRDMSATIADVLGFEAEAPFPGTSLARLWHGPSRSATAGLPFFGSALSELVPFTGGANPDPAQLLKPRWPLGALTEGEWTYIRRDGDGRQELFNVLEDPQERHNLAADPAMHETLERMKKALHRLTDGPLTPRRFNY
jgi:arylsulfatase A-like enzyme